MTATPISDKEKEEETGPVPTPPRLTPLEQNLLFLTRMGQSPVQIAVTLELSRPEVEAALARLQARFGVSSHRKLLLHGLLRGW